MKKDSFRKQIFLSILCVLVLLCIAISVTVLFRPIYYWDIENLNIPLSSGRTAEVCRKNYDILIDYNLLGGPTELVFPDFHMSEGGRIHFEEVKRIFLFCQMAACLGSVMLLLRIFRQIKVGNRDYRWLKWTGPVTVSFVGTIGLLMAWNWDLVFVGMHKILFRNDLWIFDRRTDPVIEILPEQFFMHCGIMIMVLLLLLVILCNILAFILEKNKLKHRDS